jgi:hypothetical protein
VKGFAPLSGNPPLNLAPLFRHFRERKLAAVEMTVTYKWSFRSDEDSILTRAEVLRLSAANAKAFKFPIEKRAEKTFVDLRSLNPDYPDAILVIDSSFLADLRRLNLVLKDGRLYARTQRQDTHGAWHSHLCPVTSIVGAWKYGQEWDVTFLSARTKSGDSLDLRSENVVIPCLEQSAHTQRMNTKLNEAMPRAGFHDGWLADRDGLQSHPTKPKGAAPDGDEDDVSSITTSKMSIPASEGQVVEIDRATEQNLFLSERALEQVGDAEPEPEVET